MERRKGITGVGTIWIIEETLIMITVRLGGRDKTMIRDLRIT